ncbi:hypothetical protein QAD02_006722 [Eretmocerus hayati]|uniref:Uncharacterized protein n=1 Tax=Eretmocerus hayati TaxID=131215 RepID=A0ACC2N1N9_9HYME|nr:hypothetical protein QAD02_006722 [Eretmocerus hayati]
MEGQLIGPHRLLIGEYLYFKDSSHGKRTFWVCPRYHKSDSRIQRCSARASTSNITQNDGKIIVYIGPNESSHNHRPDSLSKFDRGDGGITIAIRGLRGSAKTKKNVAHSQGLDFMEDTAKYRKFLLKFSNNPSFDRESICQVLDDIWNFDCLGVSRDGVCLLIQCNKSKVLSDLGILKSNAESISAPLSRSENLSIDTESSEVFSMTPHSINHSSQTSLVLPCTVSSGNDPKMAEDNGAQLEVCSSALEAQLIGPHRLMIGKYVYRKESSRYAKTYWRCLKNNKNGGRQRRLRHSCRARASTSNIDIIDWRLNIFFGPNESQHNHPPDPKDIEEARLNAESISKTQISCELQESAISHSSPGDDKDTVPMFWATPTSLKKTSETKRIIDKKGKRKKPEEENEDHICTKKQKIDFDIMTPPATPSDDIQDASLSETRSVQCLNPSTIVKEEYFAVDLIYEDEKMSQIVDWQSDSSSTTNKLVADDLCFTASPLTENLCHQSMTQCQIKLEFEQL